MARKKITKPGQLDLFLKKEGVYNIDGDKVKPEDLKGYYKDKYNTGKYDHDISGYKRRESLSKGIQAKKLLGLELSKEDKSFKTNKQIAVEEKKAEIKRKKEQKIKEEKRIADRKKQMKKAMQFKGIRQPGIRKEKIDKEIARLKKLGAKIPMPKRLKLIKNLLTKKRNMDLKPKPPTKPTKKKTGGRLNDGTAFIKSLYKDKL